MGFLLRVRLASFFVGAASASVAGFCLLDKDYMLAHDAIAQQVKGIYENFDECYEGPSQAYVIALENQRETETSKPAEASD
ncbi:unnamed protein product [Musa acuminata subsp. malaccensis]|uniref:(wild Malaysian banana) hypothetical protein n=1 Tax=Musa acuminata subsp. malaccensis TaxID=214687 RepID=A0A804KED6_MUSAM|nr:unnamed protein product [Musa acuminata subsp. malaccensis]